MKKQSIEGHEESHITVAELQEILGAITKDMVLVGGQSLAFWVDFYQIDMGDLPFVSRDADFLGTRANTKNLAKKLSGGG